METNSMTNTKLLINLRDGIVQVEGDEKFVRDVYNDFKERVAKPAIEAQDSNRQLEDHSERSTLAADVPRRKAKPAKTSSSDGQRAKVGEYKPKFNANLDLAGLGDFYDQYVVSSHSEKILIFATYLRDKLNLEPCSADDIYTCYETLKDRTKTPGAFLQAIRDTQKRFHFINFASIADIQLTIPGKNYFNHNLKKKMPE